MFNDAVKISKCLESLSNAGYLALQMDESGISNQLLDLKTIANGLANCDVSIHISVIGKAMAEVESVLLHRGGNEEDEYREEFQNSQYLNCMFHFDFTKLNIEYMFFEKGFSRRTGDQRVWNLDDGKLFAEIFVNHPFDTDDHDQLDFFLDTRRWPLANIDWKFPYPDNLALPLQADTLPFAPNENHFFNDFCPRVNDVNPRINTMIDSIDKTVGQRVLLDGETNTMCHVVIDYSARTLKFERLFYRPCSWEVKSGSLSFLDFGKLADSLTRGECLADLGLGY